MKQTTLTKLHSMFATIAKTHDLSIGEAACIASAFRTTEARIFQLWEEWQVTA